MTLPYSRTVNVTLTRNDAFPSRRGFGTLLHLTSQSVVGKLTASLRTRSYSSMEEVAVDFASTDDFYKAALAAFSQNPRPIQVKAGYYESSTALDADGLADELDAIFDYDQDFYFVTVEAALRDDPIVYGLISWVEAKNKVAIIDSNDADMQESTNETNIAAVHKGTVERSSVFYHTSSALYPATALAGLLSTYNFDEANTAYTAKYKNLRGITPVDLPSSAITAITGFVPQTGQAVASGHNANTYIDIGGRNFVVEGSMLTSNVFLDEIHATDWIILRTEEEALGILLNNKRVPFDDNGMQILAGAARTVMRQAARAGLIASDIDPLTGAYEPAVKITVPSVFDVPESQRKARIAPAISVRFRYAGAVHYTTINYQMTF